MANKLRVPSVQHLARNWHDSPKEIAGSFVKMALNPPYFNYNLLGHVAKDCLQFRIPEEQIVKGIKDKEGRERVLRNLLGIVPLMYDHFSGLQPDFVHDVAPNYYPIDRDLRVPFKSVFAYGVGGQVYLPWFIFWKSNPLTEIQFSLFVTLALDIISQDPDLDDARLQILDFSEPDQGKGRSLRVIDASDVEVLPRKKVVDMLSVFAEGFRMAEKKIGEIQKREAPTTKESTVDPAQTSFWDI
jgi:hypothetical protein